MMQTLMPRGANGTISGTPKMQPTPTMMQVYGIAAACCYYIAVPLLVVVFWVGLLLFLTLYNILGGIRSLAGYPSRYPHEISKDVMLQVEQDMLQEACTASVCEHVTLGSDPTHIPTQRPWPPANAPPPVLHYVKVTREPGAPKPALVLIHGTGGSSASWFPVMDGLAKHFDVYVLDLPGFGRADAPKGIEKAALPAVEDFYTTFIHRFFLETNIQQAVVIAHSYGAYLTVKFASRYPHLVSKLMLVNPAGTFATQAGWGAWLATLFKFSFPQCVARLLGSFSVKGWYTYFDMHGVKDLENTYFKTQLWCFSRADINVGQFIGRDFLYSYWKHPFLRDLLLLPMPIAFVYGETDKIIPNHNGVAIAAFADGNVPCYIMKGGGHAPMKGGRRPELFVQAVLNACATATPFGPKAKAMAPLLTDDHMCQFKTSFSYKVAMHDIERQYSHFTQLANHPTERGRVVWLTENDL